MGKLDWRNDRSTKVDELSRMDTLRSLLAEVLW